MFYKTPHGGLVGDIYMSLIHTSELCAVNPLDYLVQLLSHPEEVEGRPDLWLPWNYRPGATTEQQTA